VNNSPRANFNLRNFVAMHLKVNCSQQSAKPNCTYRTTQNIALVRASSQNSAQLMLKAIWHCNLYSQQHEIQQGYVRSRGLLGKPRHKIIRRKVLLTWLNGFRYISVEITALRLALCWQQYEKTHSTFNYIFSNDNIYVGSRM